MLNRLCRDQFLFEELVKRDFKQKYKRSVLGVLWSILSPLLTLLVMRLVFTQFFGRNTQFYTTYLFAGNIVMAYYKESTNGGMNALMANKAIISKVNVPKYLFVLSRNVSALLNFLITLVLFFVFAIIDGVPLTYTCFCIIYPILCLVVFNIGVGMVLSAWYLFFADIRYLYDVFLVLLTYLSAIFYHVEDFSPDVQKLFLLNPVYVIIKYIRTIVIDGTIPSFSYHLLCMFYAMMMLGIGCLMYKKKNNSFVYYM